MKLKVTNLTVTILVTLFLAGASVSPVFPQKIKCFVLTPPEQLLPGVKRIALADFPVTASYNYSNTSKEARGQKVLSQILSAVAEVGDKKNVEKQLTDRGGKIVDYMIADLLEADRGVREVGSGFLGLGKKEGRSFQEGAYTNIFSVVERNQMQRIIEEQQLGQAGIIDETQAAQVGKILAVDAVVLGTVSVSCGDRAFDEKRTDKKKGDYTVVCTERVATANAAIRIINVETGQVMGLKDARNQQKAKKCEGDYSNPLPAPQETVDICLHDVASQLVNYFTPVFTYQEIDLQKIKVDQYKTMAEKAKDAIDRYDLNTAFVQYTAIAQQDPYNDAVLFNLGGIHEAVGNYENALAQYEMAYKLKSKEDKYRKAIERVRKQVAFWEQLNALGIQLQPQTFEVSEAEVQATQIKKLEVKGPSSARRAIKAAPDANSETLVLVPGEIELEYLETVGTWHKVRLLDGREGYIAADETEKIR